MSIATSLLTLMSVAASPLIITKGGTYVGDFSSVTIAGTDGKQIQIGDPNLKVVSHIAGGITQTTDTPIDVNVSKCEIRTTPGKNCVTLWRVTHMYIHHNDVYGGCVFVGNFGSAIDGSISYNALYDIDGTVAPGVVQKMAGIQFQHWTRVPHVAAWNKIINKRGTMEDGISNMLSTGKSWVVGEQCAFHNNLVVCCASDSASGSGIMLFDPGAVEPGDPRAQGPCYVLGANNITVGVPNQGVTSASGSGIHVINNLTVNDGTTTKTVRWGLQLWNWDGKTTAENFGKDFVVTGNESWCLSDGKHCDFSLQSPIVGANNAVTQTTDALAIELYDSRCASNKVTVGCVPTTGTTQPSN